MAEFKLPVDFERLPDFQVPVSALRRLGQGPSEPMILFGWLRLWVTLSYQAAMAPAGELTPAGRMLFLDSLRPFLTPPVTAENVFDALVEGELLKPGLAAGHFTCARFARLNEHLDPNTRRKEKVGQEHSALRRSERAVKVEAHSQAMLLPPEIYRRRDGTTMEHPEVLRVLALIRLIDRALGKRERLKGEYTEGLLADGAHADSLLPADNEERYQFIYWVSDRREEKHPALPRTTEELCQNIETVLAMRGGWA